MAFWNNQPLSTIEISDKTVLLNTKKELLEQNKLNDIDKLLEVGMSYIIIDSDEEVFKYKDVIYNFILNNYYNDNQHKIEYSLNTIYYLLQNSIVILMYDNANDIIGLVMGKKTGVIVHNKYFNTINVNFLCIEQSYRQQAMNIVLIRLMINTAVNLNILSAFYTVARFLPCSSFGYKFYYHRPINVSKLEDTGFINKNGVLNKNLFNTYNYSKEFKQNYTIKKITYKDLVDYIKIVNLINNYNMQNKTIYEELSILEFDRIVRNNAFLKYLVYDNCDNQIVGVFICHLTKQVLNDIPVTDALLYKYALEIDTENVDSYLHYCIETIAEFNDSDVLSTQDSFETLKQMKFIKGTGYLKHYAYNFNISCIPSDLNGLVTL
jgi:hypothetical protein